MLETTDRREIPVHPSSMAARNWRKAWSTTLTKADRDPRAPLRLAGLAARRGDHKTAEYLRALGMRASKNQHCCG